MRFKRLAFVKKYERWTEEDWGKVMFFDQSTLQQFVVRKQNIRKLVGKRFDERYTVPTVTPTSSNHLGSIFLVRNCWTIFLLPGTTMNGWRYV